MDVKEMQRRILKLMQLHKISLNDLAKKTGVSLSTLEHYSNSGYDLKYPSATVIVPLADFFLVSTDYILGRCELNATYAADIKEVYEKSYETYLKKWKKDATADDITIRCQSPLYNAGYPYNLIDKINNTLSDPIDVPLSDEQMKWLEDVLDTELTPRESECVRLYFGKDYTLGEIAKVFDLTLERIRQILARALRKLKHPSRVKLIKYGYEIAIELNKDLQKAKTKKADLILELKKTCEYNDFLEEALEKVNANAKDEISRDVSLPEMNLSVRSFNCLSRWFHCRADEISIFDVKRIVMDGSIAKVRNLGKKSFCEVIRKLDEFGALSIEEIEKLSEMYPFAFKEETV